MNILNNDEYNDEYNDENNNDQIINTNPYYFLSNYHWIYPNRKMFLTIDSIPKIENTWFYIQFDWTRMKQWTKWHEMNLLLIFRNTRYRIFENDDDWYFSSDYYPHNPYFNFTRYELKNQDLLFRNNCSGYLRQISNDIYKDIYRSNLKKSKNKFVYYIRILPFQHFLNIEKYKHNSVRTFFEIAFDSEKWNDLGIESIQMKYFS
jgi:hypothetical protein